MLDSKGRTNQKAFQVLLYIICGCICRVFYLFISEDCIFQQLIHSAGISETSKVWNVVGFTLALHPCNCAVEHKRGWVLYLPASLRVGNNAIFAPSIYENKLFACQNNMKKLRITTDKYCELLKLAESQCTDFWEVLYPELYSSKLQNIHNQDIWISGR